MSDHPGAGRVSTAKDKSAFIQDTARACLTALVQVKKTAEPEKLVPGATDLAEALWDELKRRGHV